ncbi:S8 family serine peptidase [Caulobacter segnis]
MWPGRRRSTPRARPGLQVGVKPDVAAYGGAGGARPGASTGLSSLTPAGLRQDVVGTSFAAPLVARGLAGLDVATEGELDHRGPARHVAAPRGHARSR